MTTNPHISEAIRTYQEIGRDFHEIMTWHLLHGIVMISPEFMCLGYYCQQESAANPQPLAESDTVFVTYFAGDMSAQKAIAPEGIDLIMFERNFKNVRGMQVYRMEKFKQLIN
jgi:hypothetical protein